MRYSWKFGMMTVLIAGMVSAIFGQTVWTTQTSGVSANLSSVVWTGSQMVAVGTGGTVLTSPDGLKWTTQTSGTNADLNTVIWTGNQLITVGVSGTFLTSPDGVTWTAHTMNITPVNIPLDLISVAFSGNQYAVTTSGCSAENSSRICVDLITSSDGINWSEPIREQGGSYELQQVVWTGRQFLTVGLAGNAFTSSDGITWSDFSLFGNMLSVTRTDSLFVTAGFTSASGIIQTSPDGITWTTQNTGTIKALYSVVWSGKQLVSVGNSGIIITSPNGVKWTQQNSSTSNALNSIAFAGNQFVAVGNGGTILTSPQSTTAIEPRPSSNTFSLNHSSSELLINLPNSFSNSHSSAAIYSVSGNKLVEKIIESKSNFSMPINGLGQGEYFLEIKGSSSRIIQSFKIP